MSTDLFRFQHRPYAAAADNNNYVPFESIEAALDAVSGGIRREAGPAVVIGASGLGKTMLCRMLAKRLESSHEVVLLATSRLCTRRALLQNILFELDLSYRDREEGELRLALLDHLRSKHNASQGMLLLIDEAHTMPLRLLEEVRGLTNIVREGRPRVHMVLVGNQSLDERLNNPKLDAISQRIATRSYLYPMTREETCRFVSRQWTGAATDRTPLPFDEAALRRIHEAADGIPRLVNQLCDHALMLANARRLTTISDELIQETWSDLQQLPTPWQVNQRETNSHGRPTSTIIEFGTLGDDFDSPPSRNFEEDAMDRIESMQKLADEAYEIDEPAPIVISQPTPVMAEPVAIDPFASEAFDDEEWIVSPPAVVPNSTSASPIKPSLETRSPAQILNTQETLKPVPGARPAELSSSRNRAEFLIGFGQPLGQPLRQDTAENAFETPVDLSFPDTQATDPVYALESLGPAEDPFADGQEYNDEPIGQETLSRARIELTDEPELRRITGLDQLESQDQARREIEAAHQAAAELRARNAERGASAGSPDASVQSKPTSNASGFFDRTQDDKDLIVIQDPLPRNSLRIIAAPTAAPSRSMSGPASPAFREDYRSLFSRLRGS